MLVRYSRKYSLCVIFALLLIITDQDGFSFFPAINPSVHLGVDFT